MSEQAALAERLFETASAAWEPAVRERAERDPAWAWRETFADAERCLTNLALAAPVAPKRVLEVGIGYLTLTTAIRARFGDEIEISATEHPARSYLTSPAFRDLVREQRVNLEPCDLLTDELPFEGTFDVVFFCDVIEHLPVTRVPEVLRGLAGRVAPGGRLVMSSTNLSAFLRVASLAFGRGMIQDPALPQAYAGDTYGHIRLYGRADIDILLEHAGMRLVDWRYTNWERVFLDRDTIGRRLSYLGQVVTPRLLPHLSTSWSCAAVHARPLVAV